MCPAARQQSADSSSFQVQLSMKFRSLIRLSVGSNHEKDRLAPSDGLLGCLLLIDKARAKADSLKKVCPSNDMQNMIWLIFTPRYSCITLETAKKFSVTISHSPITRANLLSINLVSICVCSSPPRNLVYARLVDPSALAFSFSSHRHSYISLLFSSRFID